MIHESVLVVEIGLADDTDLTLELLFQSFECRLRSDYGLLEFIHR